MAVLVINQLIEVKFVNRMAAQNAVNILHYKVAAVVGNPTDTDVSADLDAAAGPLYRDLMSAEAAYVGSSFQIFSPIAFDRIINVVNGGVGDHAEDVLPTQTALVVTKRTGLAGRSFRGRMYVPFMPETYSTVDAKPSAAALVAADALASYPLDNITIINGGDSVTLQPVVYSRKLATAVVVIGFTLRTEWGTMRTRSQINQGDGLLP